MRVLIVDDEPAAAVRLTRMLAWLHYTDVHTAANGLIALKMVDEMRPDLVLLDISMPEVDGFDVAVRLSNPKPAIVFQTAHGEFALRAFDVHALDYLVKPVTHEKLKRALDRVSQLHLTRQRPEALNLENLAELRTACDPRKRTESRVLVRAGTGHQLIPVENVLFFFAEDSCVYAHTVDQIYMTDYTLAEIERRLPNFERANRAQLVNLVRVSGIQKKTGGYANLTLTDGSQIRVARRRTTEIRSRLSDLTA